MDNMADVKGIKRMKSSVSWRKSVKNSHASGAMIEQSTLECQEHNVGKYAPENQEPIGLINTENWREWACLDTVKRGSVVEAEA